MQKKFERGWIVRVLTVLVVVGGYSLAEPELAHPQDHSEGPPAEEELDHRLIADFQIREYKIRPKKLWKELLRKLEERGYPPEEIDEEARIVKTSFVDFESKDFEGSVVGPSPSVGPNFHVLTMRNVRMGKVSLEARVAKSEAGTELRIRARILVDGIDRRKMLRVLVDRRSTGTIESDFLERLEASLGIEPV